MLNAQDIRNLFADAYYEAARAGAYMRTATELLEGLRPLLESEQDYYKIWQQIDRALGQMLEDEAMLGALQKLKAGFIELAYQKLRASIQAAFEESEVKGWECWLHTFTESLVEWKDEIFNALPNENFPFAKERQELLQLIRKHLPYIVQERWTESHALFVQLAEQALLTKETRAQFLATAGQIQLYYFLDNEKALADFEKAKTLAPELARVERSFGEYYLKDLSIEDPQKRVETARQHFQKALQLDPDNLDTYHFMGDSYSDEGKVQVAAEWYRDALRKNPGNIDTYSRLISLCGKPDYFKDHSGEIENWVARIQKLEPVRAYSAYIDAGFAFQKNEQYETAEKWYQKAIEREPKKLAGYLNLGYLYRDWKKWSQAEQAFYKVLELDANTFDAYWELGWLYQNQEQWEKALDAFEKSLPLRPEWEQYVLDAISKMQEKLGRPEAAEASLLEALRLNPDDSQTTDSLHAIVDKWKKSPGWQYALELLQKMRDLKGEAYEAEFHNRLGIVYYENVKYDQAIEHYKKALLIRPNDAIQNENIGLAFEAAGRLQEAEAAYNRAVMNAPSDPIPHNRLGIFYYNIKQYDKAIPSYQTAIQLQPDYAVYHNNLALAQEFGGHLAEAEKAYQKAIELDAENAGYYNDLGVYYNNRGRYEDAIVQYQKAIALQSDFALYYSNVGFAYEMLGNKDKALAAYLKAVKFDKAQGGRVAKWYFNLGDYEKAEQYARITIEASPANGLAFDYLAQALQQQGKMEEAEQVLKEAIEKCEPDRDIFYNNLGLHYYNLQLYDKAVEFYQKAIELRSDYALYYDNIGLAFENLNRLDEAEKVYQKSLQLEPENALYINRLGTFYFRKGIYDKSKEHYSVTVKKAPDDPIGWENLGLACEQLEQTEEAEAAFRKALEVSKEERDLYFNRMGVFLYRQVRDKEALDFYKQAIALAPKAVYYENIGLVYERMAEWDEAQHAYEKALSCSTDTDRDLYLNRLGVFFFNLQQYDKAISYYQQAIALAPKPVYYENLGLVHSTLGQTEPAIQAYQQSAALDPTNARVFNILGNLLYRSGNPASAIPFYKKASELSPEIAFNHENLGLAYEQTGQFAEAEVAYQKALATAFEEEKSKYYNRLGVFYFNQFQNDKAIVNYQEAIQLDSDVAIYHENLGLAYEQASQLPEAEQAYLHALDLADEKDYYYNRLGTLYLKMHDSARAQESFEEAIAANPNNALYYDNLAFVFEQQTAWDKAVLAYQRAIALEPQNAVYYERIANVMEAAERYPEALGWFEKALLLQPNNASVLNDLLETIKKLSDKSDAKRVLQGLLQVEGTNRPLIQQSLDDLSDSQPNAISET